MLGKGYNHTFQAQDHCLLSHDVDEEEEEVVLVGRRGEKEIRSREDAKQ